MRDPDPETPLDSMRAFLRSQFAAAALTGMLAAGSTATDEYLAARSWQIADWMLATRGDDTMKKGSKR